MHPLTPQEACFEAGIKFGALYHQFAGTPLSVESAPSLERAIEDAIENQPHCVSVDVDIQTDAVAAAIDDGSADYVEFTGRFAVVEVVVEYQGYEVVATMSMENEYPRMRIVEVLEP
ncbi:MAG: dihydroneopterin aldolase family protein [Natronomonas sp.]